MSLSRRNLLCAGGLATGAAAVGGCGRATRTLTQPELPPRLPAAAAAEPDLAWRVLNRFAFGPRPGDLEQVRAQGPDAYLEEQLRGAGFGRKPSRLTFDDTPAAELRVRLLDTIGMEGGDLLDVPKKQVQEELQQAAVLRAVYSQWQLREVMTDHWNDHFNVSQTKGDSPFYRTPYDAKAIRAHALGRFRDLLGASARSPAMLYYLDNARSRKGVPNENYARELMELHTLGVDGGYTQEDVYEVARCFTGWTIKKNFWRGAFESRPGQHDSEDKRVLGQVIRGRSGEAGKQEGEEVLDLLARRPATARFVAWRLCRRFVADDPPEKDVTAVAAAYRKSDGSVPECVRALARCEAFRSGAGGKVKRPFDFVVSALRAVNADTDGKGPLRHLALMGQLPYHWAMPDGYPDSARAWSTSMLARWNFALALVNGRVPGTTIDLRGLAHAAGASGPAELVDAFSATVLGRALPPARREQVAQVARAAGEGERPREVAALLLSAPEFQWR